MHPELEIIKSLKQEIGGKKLVRLRNGMSNTTNWYSIKKGKIIELRLCNIYLDEIPPSIFELKFLENINLGNNKIKNLPAKIAQLKDLKFLNLRTNNLKDLPKEILDLRKLRRLDIRRNKIESFKVINELVEKGIDVFVDSLHQLPQIEPVVEGGKEIFISYAWGGESEAIVNKLEEAFLDRRIRIIRDTRDLKFKDSIKEFMIRMGKGKCIICIISKDYLESEYCMFELLQIAKNGEFNKRIFPIVLDDAKIYKSIDRLKHVEYWENESREFDKASRNISPQSLLQGFTEDIYLYSEIRNNLPKLTNILKDMYTNRIKSHIDSNFNKFIEEVLRRIED